MTNELLNSNALMASANNAFENIRRNWSPTADNPISSSNSSESTAMVSPEMSLPDDEFCKDRLSGKNRMMLIIRAKDCELKSTTDS